jgi:hypothetical protein
MAGIALPSPKWETPFRVFRNLQGVAPGEGLEGELINGSTGLPCAG